MLRAELLEPRLVFSSTSVVSHAVGAAANTAPTVAKAAALTSPGSVTGKSTTVAVLGSDNGGEANLVYTWRVTSAPQGGSASFKVNGSNAAKSDTITFTKAGSYSVSVTIVDAGGLSVTSNLQVTVASTLTSISIFPGGAKTAVGSGTLKVLGSAEALSAAGYDQFGNAVAAQPGFSWSTTTAPSGATPKVTGSGSNITLSFNKAGAYKETVSATVNGVKVSSSAAINVAAVASSITVTIVGGSTTVTGVAAQFTVSQIFDQFHNPITAATTLSWTATALPAGAAAPKFSTSGSTTTVTFALAGHYTLSVKESDQAGDAVTQSVSVAVAQTLTSITVTPGTASVKAGGTQQFQALAYDQFQKAMSAPSAYAWSTSGGSVNTSGLFTAQSSAGSDTVTAKIGSISGHATVTVSAPAPTPAPSPSPGPGPSFQDASLGTFVAGLDADGSLSRNDMLQIFARVDGSSSVSMADFADLKTIVANSTYYAMPDYVKVLSVDVVSGNAANATYQGASLGNLAAGSASTVLVKLVGKWFLGRDHPTLSSSSLTYATATGPLFVNNPSHNDEFQGELGDCYFISSLGTIADQNPQAIENMFIDNGDGTFTVRFYTGSYGAFYNADGTVSDGFSSGKGTADYVTVDRSVVVYANSGGVMAYADYGKVASNAANSLWIPLAEKAYAEWNQTGKEGRDGTNAFGSIEGGWMATVDAQVLGYNATDYSLTSSTQQAMINALAAHKSVTIGTISSSNSDDSLPGGLFGSHAYAVIGYNSSTGLFTLYNPWGMDQPNLLSWSQLEATTDGFVVTDPSGSVAIPGANVHAAAAAALWNGPSAAGVDAVFGSNDSVTWKLPVSHPH